MKDATIKIGDVVTRRDGAQFEICHFGDAFGTFRALNLGTREMEVIKASHLRPKNTNAPALVGKPDLEDLDEPTITRLKEWQKIVEGFNANRGHTAEDAKRCAEKMGYSREQFYRLRRGYDGSLRSLLRQTPNGGRGKSRLAEKVEDIVQKCIDELYVRADAPTREIVVEAVNQLCDKKGIPRVAESTIYRRMRKKSQLKLAEGKYGRTEARSMFGPAAGKYAEAVAPLRVIQIDHTPLDLFLVDEETGDKIGRAWLTIAIDVFSRMVVAIYLSYEDPNTSSVAQCIYRAVMPKDDYLKSIDVKSSWPVWGLMRTIHADNGPDFRTEELKLACGEHQMDLQWRPCATPGTGAHIERLAKRVNEEVQKLNGRIPADFKQRKHERPDKNGVYSLLDAERYLVTWITKVYHEEYHAGINSSPIKKFMDGLQGGSRPIGIPHLPPNPERLLLDLTPSEMRTVQRHGIEIDNMCYYDRLLDRFILARDPDQPKLARKFRCRTPVDDARVIYFQDPDTKQYHKIQCADRTMPKINRHELKLITKHLHDKGQRQVNMDKIKKGIRALEQLNKEVLEKRSKSSAAQSVRRKKEINKIVERNAAVMPHRVEAKKTEEAAAKAQVEQQYRDEDIPTFEVER